MCNFSGAPNAIYIRGNVTGERKVISLEAASVVQVTVAVDKVNPATGEKVGVDYFSVRVYCPDDLELANPQDARKLRAYLSAAASRKGDWVAIEGTMRRFRTKEGRDWWYVSAYDLVNWRLRESKTSELAKEAQAA